MSILSRARAIIREAEAFKEEFASKVSKGTFLEDLGNAITLSASPNQLSNIQFKVVFHFMLAMPRKQIQDKFHLGKNGVDNALRKAKEATGVNSTEEMVLKIVESLYDEALAHRK